MKIKHHISVCAALLALLGAGCDDKTDYKPGPANAPDTPGVIFDSDNAGTFVIPETSDSFTADIKLVRQKTEGALTVPVQVVEADKEITINPTVTFADGSSEATMTISLPADAKRSYRYSFSLALPHELTDYYTTLGTSTLAASVVVVSPTVATCYLQNNFDKTGGAFDVQMFQIDQWEYYFTDFMYSGYEMTFKIDPSTYLVTPIGPMVGDYEEDDGYGTWYIEGPLYPGAGGKAQVSIDGLYVYNTYTEYFEWDGGTHGIYLNSYVYFSDGSAAFDYIFIEFPDDTDIL